jgi:SPP1 family predicted phage head-tail adaptor
MLRTPVQFSRAVRDDDGAGGAVQSWEALPGAPTRAHVVALSGSERWASARVEATSNLRVTVRYFEGLTEGDAIVISGVRCNIRFVNNVEQRNRWLVLDVQRGVAPK